jgi:hypothetical protein
MMSEQADLLRQAHDGLAAAKLLDAQGYHGFAASRAYDTMFYIKKPRSRSPMPRNFSPSPNALSEGGWQATRLSCVTRSALPTSPDCWAAWDKFLMP